METTTSNHAPQQQPQEENLESGNAYFEVKEHHDQLSRDDNMLKIWGDIHGLQQGFNTLSQNLSHGLNHVYEMINVVGERIQELMRKFRIVFDFIYICFVLYIFTCLLFPCLYSNLIILSPFFILFPCIPFITIRNFLFIYIYTNFSYQNYSLYLIILVQSK